MTHTSHHLRDVAGVNTGDESVLHVDKGNHIYVPDTVATAKPRTTNQHKLDKLGVNTGDEHTQWGDSMVQHAENLEPSYNMGISPNREYTATTPYPGTTNWPAKGKRNMRMGQKLHANRSPHAFFKKSVKPLMSHDSARKVQNTFSAAGMDTKKATAKTSPKTTSAKKAQQMDLATREAQVKILKRQLANARVSPNTQGETEKGNGGCALRAPHKKRKQWHFFLSQVQKKALRKPFFSFVLKQSQNRQFLPKPPDHACLCAVRRWVGKKGYKGTLAHRLCNNKA